MVIDDRELWVVAPEDLILMKPYGGLLVHTLQFCHGASTGPGLRAQTCQREAHQLEGEP